MTSSLPFYLFSRLLIRSFARPGKDIADTADRLDMLVVVGVTELLADFTHVHVDAAVKGRELAAKDGIYQALARNYAASFPQQHFQQVELHRSQVDDLAVAAHTAGRGIK